MGFSPGKRENRDQDKAHQQCDLFVHLSRQDRDEDNEEDLGVGWSVVRHVGCEPVPEWTEVTEAQQSVEQAKKEQIVRNIKKILDLSNKDTICRC